MEAGGGLGGSPSTAWVHGSSLRVEIRPENRLLAHRKEKTEEEQGDPAMPGTCS